MRIKDYVLTIENDGYIYVGFREGIKIQSTDLNWKILKDLRRGISNLEYFRKYDSNFAKLLIKKLERSGFLTNESYASYENTFKEKNLYYYERFNSSSLETNMKIENYKVCIIGVGGVGSSVLQLLVAAGIKSFILIDYDRVEWNNLNRQFLYRPEDIGKYKVDVCENFIKSYNSSCKVQTHTEKISSSEDLLDILSDSDIDMILQCADAPSNINHIAIDVCKKLNLPFSYAGVGIDFGFFEVVDIKKLNGLSLEKFPTNQFIPKGSFGTTNSIISSYLAYDILSYIIGDKYFSKDSRVTINFS